jgi:branched-chain amino acid transport system substrate-binding protein
MCIRRIQVIFWALILTVAAGIAGSAATNALAADKPFSNLRQRQTEYAGEGREIPEPTDVREVLLGYFGPSDPANPDSDLWNAAQLAIDQANEQGGYRGKPFRLVPAWSKDPWRGGASLVTRLVYVDRVWAILGGIDGPTTHLAEQVVVKARLPLLSPVNTDKTTNLTNVPWMFSCLPGDHLQAPILAEALAAGIGQRPFVLVSSDSHDARQFTTEFEHALAKKNLVACYKHVCRPATADLRALVAQVLKATPEAVVLIADARDGARLLVPLREAGFGGKVLGGPWMGRRAFLEGAGKGAEGVLFPLLNVAGPQWQAFHAAFEKRFHKPPDYATASAYDTTQLLVAAVRKAGLNRARIGDAVRELSPWTGAAGTIEWDPSGSNTRPVRLGTVKDGRVVAAVDQQ